ncbi:MAG: hypothetical protein IPL90_19705 [Holophagales bacterium]|nr:hypothetical protein [Holophagales bacterium]
MVTAGPPGQALRFGISTVIDKAPAEPTSTERVAVFAGPPSIEKVKVTVAVPSAADSDAAIVKFAAWNDGPVRRTSGGFTVTPAGIEVGVTRMLDCGGHGVRPTEAETSAEGPVRQRETPDGLIEGKKSATPTFTVMVVCTLIPAWSWTRTFTVLGPAVMPAAAETAKETVWAGGSIGTMMGEGVIVSPAGRPGNVTVGEP